MKFSYNELVQRVDVYLQQKRSTSKLWALMLPEQLFTPSLWLWEKRSVAIGSAWGTAWALAPVPMQTIFAILCSARSKGNIPMSVLTCWISFPGYQIVAWPLQWYAGAWLLSYCSTGSGVSMELIQQTAAAATEGWRNALHLLSGVNLWILGVEFILGCLLSCALLGALVYGGILLLWRKK